MRSCLVAAITVEPTPIYGSNTFPLCWVSDRTRRSTSSTGNWQGWMVFSTWLFLTFGKIQTSPGFLPRGLHDNWPTLGPLKYFLPGYFNGTRMGSRLKM